ncbi:MAG: hypothetical protein HYX46_03190 [Betaproteobacteria bacterium]|nr:hypothetical protein [Betaproteobacteria bacterium]
MRPLGPLRKARFWQIAAGSLAAMLLAATAVACEIPTDEGSMPLRRAVTRVKYLPETEAWQKTLPAGAIAQFVLLVDSPQKIGGRCYWPVEVRASGALWKRFLVAADGHRVMER